MANLFNRYQTSKMPSGGIGQLVEELVNKAKYQRRGFERRWYDNNFFDDGYHFRYLSRVDNKIVDLSDRASIFQPIRSIPKSSRMLRGVANLLQGLSPTPVVYPENVDASQYPPIVSPGQPQVDPQTGQQIPAQPTTQPNPEYLQAVEDTKLVARHTGHWLTEEMKKQELEQKLALALILAGKHSVSYLKIWPDAEKEDIRTANFDAFDIYLQGDQNDLEELPSITSGQPRRIAAIKADPRFDPEKVAKLTPDNRRSSSEIKEAYERARHGGESNPDATATIMEKEVFIKEYLDEDNTPRIRMQPNGDRILKNTKPGDVVLRHAFVHGNVASLDEYAEIKTYPYVDFRFEPGPLYQVPLMERFMQANKSLDLIASRVERYTHTMVTGSWSKKIGEQFEIDNGAGGQVLEYNATPPIQNTIAPVPPFVFNYMNFLEGLMEEQGVNTRFPPGIRSAQAIEIIKELEYSRWAVASNQFKQSVKRVAEKFLDLADNYFITPKTVYYLEKGEPQYFDIIGKSALEGRKRVKVETPEGVVPINKDYRVDIQIESGLAYTEAAKKENAKALLDYMIQLAQIGAIGMDALKIVIEKVFEEYGFGPTQDLMEALEEYGAMGNMNQTQIQGMKVAVAEVMGDMQKRGVIPTQGQRMQEQMVSHAEHDANVQTGSLPGEGNVLGGGIKL